MLTSATIDAEIGTRIGLADDAHDRIDVGSPFDFAKQAMLYCAMDLPDPRSGEWIYAVIDELVTLIEAAGGRTLALFTSWRAMDTAAASLDERLDFDVFTQRDMPKPALLSRFIDDETSVLCATRSFWQGVDVPGPALTLLTIDRLPFPRPDDPLLQARRDRAGQRAFATVDLPRAATMLAQGAGRLIRTADDRGVVAVLDSRLGRASYRWTLIKAPPANGKNSGSERGHRLPRGHPGQRLTPWSSPPSTSARSPCSLDRSSGSDTLPAAFNGASSISGGDWHRESHALTMR